MRKRERLAGSKAYRLRFEAEKLRLPSMLRHTESAADALSDLLADAVLPADETEEERKRRGAGGADGQAGRRIQRSADVQAAAEKADSAAVRGGADRAAGGRDRRAGRGRSCVHARSKDGAENRGVHPEKSGKLVILLFAVMMTYMLSSLSGCMPIAQSLLESLVIGTYPAEEDDLIAAERAYCEMEDALQDELDRYGEIHPGYDEVQVEQMEIWHDPYVLLALVSARIGGEWTVDTAMPTLEAAVRAAV